ncbi:MAG: glutaredoxin [Thermoplasmata archaeon]|nr:glutaredoxin [Thermoplasmata archaeon]
MPRPRAPIRARWVQDMAENRDAQDLREQLGRKDLNDDPGTRDVDNDPGRRELEKLSARPTTPQVLGVSSSISGGLS